VETQPRDNALNPGQVIRYISDNRCQSISIHLDLQSIKIKMEASNLQPGQNLAHLLPPSWKADIQRWFAEDTPSFDWAGFVVGEEEQEAILWGKSGVGPFLCLSFWADI